MCKHVDGTNAWDGFTFRVAVRESCIGHDPKSQPGLLLFPEERWTLQEGLIRGQSVGSENNDPPAGPRGPESGRFTALSHGVSRCSGMGCSPSVSCSRAWKGSLCPIQIKYEPIYHLELSLTWVKLIFVLFNPINPKYINIKYY